MIYAWIRVASLVVVFFLKSRLAPVTYHCAFLALLLSHYTLAFGYALPRIGRQLRPGPGRRVLVVTAAVSALTAWTSWPSIVAFFAPHFALSEAYVPFGRRVAPARLLAARFAFHLTAYLFVVRGEPTASFLGESVVVTTVFVAWLASGAWVAYLTSTDPLARQDRSWHVPYELATVALVAASFATTITWIDLIFYHIAGWVLLPLTEPAARRARPATIFGVATVVTVVAFWSLTPAAGSSWSINLAELDRVAIALGFVHITTSYAWSRHNPAWLRRWTEAASGASGR